MGIFEVIQKCLMHSSSAQVDPEKHDTSNWTKLQILRNVTCLVDEEKINEVLFEYAKTIEIIAIKYPNFNISTRIDWAIAKSFSPEWFGEELVNRMNNVMLLSALLITVTAAFFIVPPQLDIGDGQKNDTDLRLFYYACGLANSFFMISIVVGISFVENALSRSYTDSDEFELIISQYFYKNVSQFTSVFGAWIFILSLTLPMWNMYKQLDCIVFTALSGLVVVYLAYIQSTMSGEASAKQFYRIQKFKPLVDEDGRLKPEYYPSTAPIPQSEIKYLYL